MSLEATIAENTAAIRELIAAIANGIPTTAAQLAAVVAEAPAAVTVKKQAKATVATNGASSTPGASFSAGATAQQPAAEAAAATTSPAAASVTYDQVKAAITRAANAKGRDAVLILLKEFGVAKGPDLKPEQYADFVAKANTLLVA